MIDSHVHIFPDSMLNDDSSLARDPVYSALHGRDVKKAGMDDLVRHMDEHGIERSVAMGFAFESPDLCRVFNEGLMQSCLRFPGRVIPFASMSPETPDPALELQSITKLGFRGVGEIAFYRDGFGAGKGEWLAEVLKAAREFNLLVCIHVNEPVGHNYPGKYPTDFGILYKAIHENPGTRIILSHWGGGMLFYEMMPEVKEAFRDVFYDTAATPFLYDAGIYRRAIDITGSRKILFGTDFPLLSAGRYVKTIRAQEIEKADLENIMRNNISRILG